MKDKHIILDLCSGTGAWSLPYRQAGYDVIEVDIKNGDDIRLFKKPDKPILGILAAPPCTAFAISGARWWKQKGQSALLEGLAIVDACLRIIIICEPKFWALENPQGRLIHYLGKPKFIFHPYEYGDPWTKKTYLCGNFNIPKKSPVEPTQINRIRNMPPGPDRQMRRAITPSGFARAFFEANR